nr:MAG TPA: hypothetical protein [Caudoviricetes sp.]
MNMEILMMISLAYLGYRIGRKPGEKFFYKD